MSFFVLRSKTKTNRSYASRQEEQQYLQNAGRYDCQICPGECDHSFGSFSKYWSLMQDGLKTNSNDESGPLLMPFVGMLYDDYLRKRVDWTRPLDTILPVTRLLTKQQELAASPVQRWYDEQCLIREWTVCPIADGANRWLSLGNQSKIASFPTGQDLNENGAARWIDLVCISTLHKQYQFDTNDVKLDEATFLLQLGSFTKARNNNIDLQRDKILCKDYEYRKFGEVAPQWNHCQIHDSRKMCITLPLLKPTAASNMLNDPNARPIDFKRMCQSFTTVSEGTLSNNQQFNNNSRQHSQQQSGFTDDESNRRHNANNDSRGEGGRGREKVIRRSILNREDPFDPHMRDCDEEEGGRHDEEAEGEWNDSQSSESAAALNRSKFIANEVEEVEDMVPLSELEIRNTLPRPRSQQQKQKKRDRDQDQDEIIQELLSSPTKQQTITTFLKKRTTGKDKEEEEEESISLHFSEE